MHDSNSSQGEYADEIIRFETTDNECIGDPDADRDTEDETMRIDKAFVLVTAIAFTAPLSLAEEAEWSGFMTDYSQLEKIEDGTADFRFLIEDWDDRMESFNAIMVDQPEIFISEDSPYKGAKPRHLEALAEAFRAGLVTALSDGGWYVVDKPGPNVMYARVGITNLKLNKRKKSVLGYTPIGLVGGTVVSAAQSDIAKKADLVGAVFELEIFDSATDERIVAIIDHARIDGDLANWEEMEQRTLLYGMLASCRLNNAKFEEEMRVNCFAEHLKRLEEIQAQ